MSYDDGSGLSVLGILLYLVVIAFFVYCMWRIFEKAAKPGWASIIPVPLSVDAAKSCEWIIR